MRAAAERRSGTLGGALSIFSFVPRTPFPRPPSHPPLVLSPFLSAAWGGLHLSGPEPGLGLEPLLDDFKACLLPTLISKACPQGLGFSRWTTAAGADVEQAGQRSRQVLDLVVRLCGAHPWAVLDPEALGDDGPEATMLMRLLRSRTVVAGAGEGLSAAAAAAVLVELMGGGDDNE